MKKWTWSFNESKRFIELVNILDTNFYGYRYANYEWNLSN